MNITHLSYHNFKGRNFDSDLSPLTVITGNNFAAKTSIPLAIRLAMRGCLPPPIGVKGIYSLAGNPNGPGKMDITVTLENREIKWAWTRNAAGKITTEGGCPSDLVMPELLAEPKIFFGKTGAERTKIIFDACKVVEFGASTITDRFREVNVMPAAMCSEIKIQVANFLCDLGTPSPQDLCSALIDWLKTQVKQSNDEAKYVQNSFSGFTLPSGKVVDVSKELAEKRQELAKLQVSKDREVIAWKLAQLPVTATPNQIREQLQKLRSNLPDVPMDDDLEDQIAAEQCRFNMLKDANLNLGGQLEYFRNHIKTIQAHEACPVCMTAKKGWKDAAIADTSLRIEALTDTIARNSVAASKIEVQVLALKKLYQLNVDIERCEKELAVATKTETERKSLQAKIASLPDSNESKEQAEQLQIEIRNLEQKQSVWEQVKRDNEKRAELEQKVLRATCAAETFKAVLKIVTEEQERLIDTAFKDVLTTAKYFTDGLLNSSLEFVDGELGRRVSKKDVDMGSVAKIGSWISHEVFSGTEELLAYAGFAVSLAQQAPLKIVFLDELGRLDPQRKKSVALRMLSLIETEIIDQAILVDVDGSAYQEIDSPIFQLITL